MQFENEELQILDYLSRRWSALDFDDSPTLMSATLNKQRDKFQGLEKVHKQLWVLESERRKFMAEGDKDQLDYEAIGINAYKTTLLNDERQRLIQEVNQAFQVNEVEKLYALEGK